MNWVRAGLSVCFGGCRCSAPAPGCGSCWPPSVLAFLAASALVRRSLFLSALLGGGWLRCPMSCMLGSSAPLHVFPRCC